MELSKQVTNLELSKKLKELGVKQKSYFFWYLFDDGTWDIDPEVFGKWGIDKVSAFTVAELGEMLIPMVITYRSAKDYWECAYDPRGICLTAKTEADARATMLIYLIENILMDIP